MVSLPWLPELRQNGHGVCDERASAQCDATRKDDDDIDDVDERIRKFLIFLRCVLRCILLVGATRDTGTGTELHWYLNRGGGDAAATATQGGEREAETVECSAYA